MDPDDSSLDDDDPGIGHDDYFTVHNRTALIAGYKLDSEPEQLFDDLVYLAADICEAPIALVTLVEDQRAWFKAHQGVDVAETDIEASICRLGLAEEGLFVVPDLKANPLTAETSWVAGPPRVRFYAGAPLRTSAGDTLGMLCVMDKFSRPSGLTTRQKRALTTLGRHAIMSIEMHRLLCEFAMPPR